MRSVVKILVALAILLLIGILLYSRFAPDDDSAVVVEPERQVETQPEFPISPPTPPPPEAVDDGDETPTAPPPPPPPKPPAMAESDGPVEALLQEQFGNGLMAAILRPKELVRHIVVTVDNLDRTPIPMRFWPIQGVAGDLVIDGGGDFMTIAPQNAKRYDRHVRAFTQADPKKLVNTYRFLYPLFQEAYEDLGYPDGYFNDRLVAVIDHLIKAPAPKPPVSLVQPSVFYKYKRDELEKNASWGQKTLIRMGSAHAKAVKVQLQRLRDELVAAAAG